MNNLLALFGAIVLTLLGIFWYENHYTYHDNMSLAEFVQKSIGDWPR